MAKAKKSKSEKIAKIDLTNLTPRQKLKVLKTGKPIKEKKVKIHHYKTGRFIYVKGSEYNEFWSKYSAEKKEYERQKNISEQEARRADFKSTDSTEVKELIKKNKLRDSKGRFLSKEMKKEILDLSVKLDVMKVDYSLKNLVSETEKFEPSEIAGKKIVIPSGIEQRFYWNIQNEIDRGNVGEGVKFIIKDFSGTVVYSGYDESYVLKALMNYNLKIKQAEKKFENGYTDSKGNKVEKNNMTVYPRLGVTESSFKDLKKGLVTEELIIDYSKLDTNLGADYNSQFKDLLGL